MTKVLDSMPISKLRRDAAAALRRVRNSKHPVVITQRGRAAAVMLSIEAYKRSEFERHLLMALGRAEKEIAAGKGFDLVAVMREPDELLGEQR